MWQRVQTLYLFLSLALTASLFFCSKSEGVSYISYLPYLILLIIIALLNLLALTSYKFRVFQMRTAVLAAIITLALQIWIGVELFVGVISSVTAVFPIASVILNLLAARGIMADELMVRSSSRLRSARSSKRKHK